MAGSSGVLLGGWLSCFVLVCLPSVLGGGLGLEFCSLFSGLFAGGLAAWLWWGCWFMGWFCLESLILAQDERWRRA